MNSIVAEKIIYESNQLQVTYKVKYNEELRRFSVPSSATWESVISKISALFSLNIDSIVVKYEDDEKELVTIDSDAELQEAVRVFLNQSEERSNLILRLVVFEIPQKTKSIQQHQHQEQQEQQLQQKQYYCPFRNLKWSSGSRGGQQKCDWKEKREKCRAALMQLDEKGFKCKGKNIHALKSCDYDVDKAVEYLVNKNTKCEKFKTDMVKLQELGFENKWTNCWVLKRTGGDIDKAVSILTQAKALQEKGCDNQHFAAKLLIKCDGDVQKVAEIWNKKREAHLEKRQKCMERKMKKHCDWKQNKCEWKKNKCEWKKHSDWKQNKCEWKKNKCEWKKNKCEWKKNKSEWKKNKCEWKNKKNHCKQWKERKHCSNCGDNKDMKKCENEGC